FGSKCYGMLYNMESQYCIPTGGISAHQAIPNSTEWAFNSREAPVNPIWTS
ncbi:lectin BRA-3, partial [Biomphalaria pfeifferi]